MDRGDNFLRRTEKLLKKARELAVLCGVDVALIIFSTTGEMFEYSSSDMMGIFTKRTALKGSTQLVPAAAEIKPEEQPAAQENQALAREVGPSTSSLVPLSTDDTPETKCIFGPANLSLDDIQQMGPLGKIFLKKKEDTTRGSTSN